MRGSSPQFQMLIINLEDSSLWIPVWQSNVLAESTSDGKHISIPEQSCPIILHKPVLAVSATNPLGKPEWFSAGFLIQKIRSPLIVGGGLSTYTTSKRVVLNLLQLVYFSEIKAADYAIVFRPRWWHKQIQLSVWEYQGTIEKD